MKALIAVPLLAGSLLACAPAQADSFSLTISNGSYGRDCCGSHHRKALSYLEVRKRLDRYGYCNYGSFDRWGDDYRVRARDRFGRDVFLQVNVFSGTVTKVDYPKRGYGWGGDWDGHDGHGRHDDRGRKDDHGRDGRDGHGRR